MKKESKSRQRSIRLKTEICENIEQLAIEENRTFNNMVETLLMKALERVPN